MPDDQEESSPTPDAGVPDEAGSVAVVGLGASAGGLEALSAALASLPVDVPFAIVVAQHMSEMPGSPLVELLAAASDLKVISAEEGSPLEPGVVLVCPAGEDITVGRQQVNLAQRHGGAGPHPSIDALFASMAQTHPENAVGFVLSGTGSDGTEGLRTLRLRGGLALVQAPESAKFPAMPQSALSAGNADLVIMPEELGATLGRIGGPGVVAETPAGEAVTDDIAGIVSEMRRITGVDFSEYKGGTLQRQVGRRMALVGAADFKAYSRILLSDPREPEALQAALLVTVTSFYRDPESWASLADHLAEPIRRAEPGSEFRIWVPGCATGEEAYTVAMVVARLLGDPADLAARVKVFATDLSEEALDVARRGRYTEQAVSAIPPERLDRYWVRTPAGRQASSVLRDAIVFAKHNIATHPPFPRLDLISLRNTLIYFQTPLQRRVLRLCHYALVPGGLLFLGNAERVSDTATMFGVVDAPHRIYERSPGPSSEAMPVVSIPVPRPRVETTAESVREALLDRYVPPSLVIDDNNDVVEVHGDVSAWCWVAPGAPSAQLTALLREEMRGPVKGLLLRLRHGDVDEVRSAVDAPDGQIMMTASVLPGGHHPHLAVVAFEPVAATVPAPVPSEPLSEVEVVSRELELTQTALQATVEDLSASNEELRALNEELQASSEEAQSANEELGAANEELSTLNEELQVRSATLTAAKRDLENIQASVSSGLIIVDRDLRVTRFTHPAVRLFALIDEDLGRELTTIQTTATIPDLSAILRNAVSGQRSAMVSVTGPERDSMLQVQPYLAEDGRVLGAVVVVTDVTELAAAQRGVAESLRRFNAVTDALHEVVWQADLEGNLSFLSLGIENLFGLSRDRVLADPALFFAAVHPDDRERVVVARSSASKDWRIRYRVRRPDDTVRWVQESSTLVPESPEGPAFIVGSIFDISDRIMAEESAKSQYATLQAFFRSTDVGLLLIDGEERIVRANPGFVRMSGFSASALSGVPVRSICDLGGDPNHPDPQWPVNPGVRRGRLTAHDGSVHLVNVDVQAVSGSARSGGGSSIVTVYDLTQLLETTGGLAEQVRFDQQTGLYSRAHFVSRVGEEIARAKRTGTSVGLLWVDLDGFKEVNDTYGHRAGDAALVEVAMRLSHATRVQDPVGRLGGDEFGVIVTEIAQPDALDLLTDRVLNLLREPIATADGVVFVTGSVGIAFAPEDGDSAEALLHNADTAMYVAKSLGGDARSYFQDSMNRAAHDRATLIEELGVAVREGGFLMHYQPVVEVGTGRLVMVEALLRWKRDDGMLTADEFLDKAEAAGQLRALGRIGRGMVQSDLLEFEEVAQLADVPLSVNLHVTELDEKELTASLLHWDPPGGLSRIMIEVTEQALLPGAGHPLEALTLLQRLGARICIDDFGTGYSNTVMLARLRPAIVKIDQSLLESAGSGGSGEQLLAAMIQTAHALNAQVVAEGVEQQAQHELISRLGVDLAQGHFYARPMGLPDLKQWVAENATGVASGS